MDGDHLFCGAGPRDRAQEGKEASGSTASPMQKMLGLAEGKRAP